MKWIHMFHLRPFLQIPKIMVTFWPIYIPRLFRESTTYEPTYTKTKQVKNLVSKRLFQAGLGDCAKTITE